MKFSLKSPEKRYQSRFLVGEKAKIFPRALPPEPPANFGDPLGVFVPLPPNDTLDPLLYYLYPIIIIIIQ